MAGRLERIWRKRCRRGPMDPRSRVELRAGAGLVDDAKRSRTRQVTSVSRERWKAAAEALGQHVDPVLRRANLLISGVDLENSRGNMLRVGSGRLRVNGETRPCERLDEQLPGWRAERRHRWGGGVYASVLADGKIAVGDPVEGARAAPRKPEQSLRRRRPPPRRRRAGSRSLRPRRFHRPLPRAHPHPPVPGSGLSRGSLPGHASRGCLHGRRPERLGDRHGARGYVLHQTCSRTPSGHQPSALLEQRGV